MATSNSTATLAAWSFLDDYHRHQNDLFDLAVLMQTVFCQNVGGPIDRDDFIDVYRIALENSQLFQRLAKQKRYLWPSLYPAFAHMLAEYIIDDIWPTIPPCP